MQKKNYLTEKVFKNSWSYANANLHTFMDAPLYTVEKSFGVYRNGFYSTVSSTVSLTIYGGFAKE